MIALIQRVRKASVIVDDRVIGEIGAGLLALIGVEKDDSERNAGRMLDRLLGYQVFQDADDRMNRSLNDVEGGLLLVPQFTLAADTARDPPGFSTAAPPAHAERLFAVLENLARASYPRVSSGRFGAEMEVSLVNHGPVTFWLTA